MVLIMASYQESTIPATTWRRAKQIIVGNAYRADKYVTFVEEDIVVLGEDKHIAQDTGIIRIKYKPGQMIQLRDPATNEPTDNVISQDLVYQAIASLYMDLVEARERLLESGSGNSVEPLG